MESEMAGLLMTEKPKAIPVKLHADVVKLARIAAAYRGGTMTDLLSDSLRPILTKIVEEEAAKQMKPTKGKGRPDHLVKAEPESKSADRDTEIVRLVAEGVEQRVVAERFGVSQPTISRIVRRAKGEGQS